MNLDAFFSWVNWPYLFVFIKNIFAALAIFFIGWILAGKTDRFIRKRLGNNKGLQADDTIRPLIASIAKYAILAATIYAALDIAGIPASSLLAVFGAAGLAIALAVQGTLSNVASGLMLIILRSIRVGEFIETPSVSGMVKEIGLFTTELKTSDGLHISVPNSEIWSKHIINYSRYKARRVDIVLQISRDNDLAEIIEKLHAKTKNNNLVVADKTVNVLINNFSANNAEIIVRCWLGSDNLARDKSALAAELNQNLRDMGVKFPPVLPIR